jgi:hypothetical protein
MKKRHQSDGDRAIDEAKRAAAEEARKPLMRKVVIAEVKDIASDLKMRPALAARLIDPDEVSIDDDGEPSRDDIKRLLKALAKEVPELAGEGGGRGGMGDGGGGNRGGTKPGDMNDWVRDRLAARRGA